MGGALAGGDPHLSRIRLLSLFSGCGGMDLGAEGGFTFLGRRYPRLPVDVVHASDIDQRAVKMYNDYFSTKAVIKDVRSLVTDEIPTFDLLTGGFPCQSFSISAQNPKRLGFVDERGQLFFEIKRLLEEGNPKAFIAENVKGLLSANGGEAFPLILSELEEAGYHVRWKLLNAAHFGVPQKRERVIIVGFSSQDAAERFAFPRPTTQSSPVALREVIEPLGDIDEKFFFSDRAVRGMRETKNSRAMNKGRAQDIDGPCNTVSTHLAKVSLNSTDPVLKVNERFRMFTPREVARIQSFPEDYPLDVVKSTAYFGLGNAVPPVLMWHVTKSVLRAALPDVALPQARKVKAA